MMRLTVLARACARVFVLATLTLGTLRGTPGIQQQPANQTAAVNQSFSFGVTAFPTNSADTLVLQWYFNGAPIYGANADVYSCANAQPGQAGTYKVTATDSTGSVTSSAATLTVVPEARPVAPSTLGGEDFSTDGGSVTVFGYSGFVPTATEWFKDGQLDTAITGNYLLLAVEPSTAGSYMEVVGNSAGAFTAVAAQVEPLAAPPSYPWVAAQAYSGVVYFALSNPAQIARYNMGTGSWLAPVSLPSAPTAMEVLPEGVYVALGRTCYLYSPDLSSSQPITNTAVAVTEIFSNASYVYLLGPSADNSYSASIASINRSTAQVAWTSTLGAYTAFAGLAPSAATGLAYGWPYWEYGTQLMALALNPDGSVTEPSSPGLGLWGYADIAARVMMSPDGSTLYLQTGEVASASTYQPQTSLGLPVTDVCFLSDGSVVALRDTGLTLYSAGSLAEEGIAPIAPGYQRIFANASTVFAFAPPAVPGGAIGVASAAESQIAAQPRAAFPALTAQQSAAVAIAPDQIFLGSDGVVYLLDRPVGNILRWSPSSGYLAAIPLSGVPLGMTYSAELNRIYVFYGDRRITKIDLGASTAEAPFFTSFIGIDNILACGDYLYAVVNLFQSSGNAQLLINASGTITDNQSYGYYDYFPNWNDALGEIFNIANQLELEVLPISAGAFGTPQLSAYPPATTFKDPLRFSPDGSEIVLPNGLLYSATTLTQTAVLGASLVDAAFIGNTVYSLCPSASGSATVTISSPPSYLASGSVAIAGTPLRILTLSSSQLLVVTEQPTGPLLTLISPAGAITSQQASTGAPLQEPLITQEPATITVAPGATATFTVTASGSSLTYDWTNESNYLPVGSGPTLTFVNVTAAQAGVYQAYVSGNGGSASSIPVALYVTVPPAFALQPRSASVSAGTSIYLSAAANSFPAATYQWYLNGAAIPGANTQSYEIAGASSATAGTYTCVATNPFGSTTSSPAVVSVAGPAQSPQFTLQPGPLSANSGATVLFSVAATGSPAPTYQWYFDGAPIAGATSASLSLAGVTTAQTGTYYATASNAGGVATSATATLTVSATQATLVTTPPASQSIAVGGSATLSVAAAGSAPLTYQWSFNGSALAGATTPSYALSNAQVANSGNYTVTVSGPGGTVEAGAVIAVSGPSGAPGIQAQPQSETVQAGSTVAFSVEPSGTVTTDAVTGRATSATAYQWYRNGLAVAGATDATLVIAGASYADAGAYSCLLANAAGATLSGAANLSIVQSGNPGRLIDVSCRANVGTGGNILITGFVVGGQGTVGDLPVLVRSSGPALTGLGVAGALPDPSLELYDSVAGSAPLATDAGWQGNPSIVSTAATLGAFAWPNSSSLDSALLENLSGGGYTAQTLGTSGDTGVALSEIYDATAPGAYVAGVSPRLVNISARVQVGTGGNQLIAGFVIGGDTAVTVLIRASGPALAQFGVTGLLADPQLQVFATGSTNTLLTTRTAWSGDAQIAAAAAKVGAFAWKDASSLDSAVIVTLPPGAYTANVLGATGDTGVALIEVYEMP